MQQSGCMKSLQNPHEHVLSVLACNRDVGYSHTFATCDLWPSAGWRPRGATERVERESRPSERRESAAAASLFH